MSFEPHKISEETYLTYRRADDSFRQVGRHGWCLPELAIISGTITVSRKIFRRFGAMLHKHLGGGGGEGGHPSSPNRVKCELIQTELYSVTIDHLIFKLYIQHLSSYKGRQDMWCYPS